MKIRIAYLGVLVAISLALLALYSHWPWNPGRLGPLAQKFPWLHFVWLYDFALFEYRNRLIGVFFVLPLILGALTLKRLGALIAFLASQVAAVPILVSLDASPEFWLWNVFFLMAPVVIVYLVAFESNWRARIRQVYEERRRDQETFIQKIVEAQENERRYIARELHDDTIQVLVAITHQAGKIISRNAAGVRRAALMRDGIAEWFKRKDSDPRNASEHFLPALEKQVEVLSSLCSENIDDAKFLNDTLTKAVDDLRRITQNLRPVTLDELGLLPALRWLVNEYNVDSKARTTLLLVGVERKLPPEIEVNIFRIAQEALANIKHHSDAEEARITVEFLSSGIRLRIEDNGRGFVVPEKITTLTAHNKLGLIGIYERTRSLEGTCELSSQLGIGTSITVEVGTDKSSIAGSDKEEK